MKYSRRLLPFFSAFVAYAAWDIIDQNVLQPYDPLIGGFVIDWAVVGIVGLGTVLVQNYWQRRKLHQASEIKTPAFNPLMMNHLVQQSNLLSEYLADIQDTVGDSITLEGQQQQRSLRQAMVNISHAQSVLEEMCGLVGAPPVSTPPIEQLQRQYN